MPPNTSMPLTIRLSSHSSPMKIGAGATLTRLCCRSDSKWLQQGTREGCPDYSSCSLVNGLALPFTCLGDYLFEGFGQAIDIGDVVAIDCPGLRFLLGCCRLTINSN